MSSSTAGSASASSSSRKRGVDVILTSRGKSLQAGESCSFRLIKGPSQTISADPVDPKAPFQKFPLLAKFPESVVQPHFDSMPWCNGRLYQQDVPKPIDDSDEDEDDNEANKKKKKRWRGYASRNEPVPRQWILQEQVDFLETMVARREKKKVGGATSSSTDQNSISTKLSSRYEGLPEYNPSHYALIMVPPPSAASSSDINSNQNHHNNNELIVRILPNPSSTIVFSQPASRITLSLSEAEQVIQDQRMGIRTMHHLIDNDPKGSSSSSTGPTATGVQASTNGGGGSGVAATMLGPRRMMMTNKNTSKSRLLDKLKKKVQSDGGDDMEDADDVMGDVAFRNRKGNTGSGGAGARSGTAGGGGTARKELLQTLGDGVTVSDEGVLGGTNDALFGGKQRFVTYQPDAPSSDFATASQTAKRGLGDAPSGLEERGADGAAMADDFYQRDVQAEYEELDYDANEQFDDDDVDVGEKEVVVDDGYEQDDDDEDDDELEQEDAVSGAEGLASVAGFKLMLAKARGEVSVSATAASRAASDAANGDKKADDNTPTGKSDDDGGSDHMSKIMAAAEKTAQAAKDKAAAALGKKPPTTSAIQVDENGLRIITLDAVRNEIWLNHGSIPMKRLMKIFDVKKKSTAERQEKFRAVIKELCNMETDPVVGRTLVLKQHYAKMPNPS